MKKILILLFVFAALGVQATTPPEVNEKVLKAFKETFIKATDVVWQEVQDIYQASFKQSDIISRASYDKEGNLLTTTRYYQQEELPVHIISKLKKRYPGKTIFGITEVTTGSDVLYHITLNDEKNWYVIKSDNWGSMELFKKFRKG